MLRISGATAALRVLAYNKPAGVVCTRRDEQGRPVARGKGVRPGQALVNEFHDAKLKVRAE